MNVWHWLVPGGWWYLDVPWRPGEGQYQVCGTSHRVYDDLALERRLGAGGIFEVRWRGVVRTNATHVLIDAPPPLPEPHHFYYVGLWMQKRA